MTSIVATRVGVLLVGLPGFYEDLLRREFEHDAGIRVGRAPEQGTEAEPLDFDAVILAGMSAPSLRRAVDLGARMRRVIGTIAITDDEPRGDVYIVSPAGRNVTRLELAQVIRVVGGGLRVAGSEQGTKG